VSEPTGWTNLQATQKAALDRLIDLFGYEGGDLVEGINAVERYVRQLERRLAAIDPKETP